jgi:carbamoyl-phosphate synthase large subunit
VSLAVPTLLITGAGGPLGVNVTRSLRRADEPLRLIGTDANPWHLPLALCDRVYRIPPAKERARYRAALAIIRAAEAVDAIVPTHPVEVRAIAELRDAGALAGVGTALPRLEVLGVADDKLATWQCLAAAGVPVPATVRLDGRDDVFRAFARLGGGGAPVWVRGAGAPGLGIGGAALPARDPDVACAWVEHHRGWGRMAASEYLPGANLTWMAAYARGQLLCCAQRERLEYVLPHVAPSGITGAPAVSRTIDRDDVHLLGVQAVAALDAAPHGVYFVDAKEDGAGMPRVTEINAGRCGTTVHFYTEAGCNFPWTLARLALGRDVPMLPQPRAAVPADLYWVRTLDCGPVLVRGAAEFHAYPTAGIDPGEAP